MGIIRDDDRFLPREDRPIWTAIFMICVAALVFVAAIVWMARLL